MNRSFAQNTIATTATKTGFAFIVTSLFFLWSFSNDTLFFYVKIDTTKKPPFPIDEAYYYDKPVEAVDLLISCYRIFEKKERYKQLFNDPVFFIDSVNVTRIEMQEYQPTDIAIVTVYKDTNAIKLVAGQ